MTWKHFLMFVRIGSATARRETAGMASLVALMLLILFVYAYVWKAAAVGGLGNEYEASRYLWYILLTEVIVIGTPLLHRNVQSSVFSGEFQARLVSPVSHLFEIYARGIGEILVRFSALVSIGALATYAFTGNGPSNYSGFIASLALVPFAMATLAILYIGIGVSSVWFGDVLPLYWVVQKTLFICGGLLTPLTFYPDFLQTISLCTPFAAVLYGTARHIFEFDPLIWMSSAVILLLWCAMSLIFVRFLSRKAQEFVMSGRRIS